MHQRYEGCGSSHSKILKFYFFGLYTTRVLFSPKKIFGGGGGGGSLTWAKVLVFVLKVHLLYLMMIPTQF